MRRARIRWTAFLVAAVMVLGICTACVPQKKEAQAMENIEIGDYIQLGKYYEVPILWRCIDIDENGPLMLSDRVLCIKPFDVGGGLVRFSWTDRR